MIRYPMLNFLDIVFIDFGLSLALIEMQVSFQAKTVEEVIKRYKRAYYFQHSLILIFAIFLIFYELTNAIVMEMTPFLFKVSSASYVLLTLLKFTLYVWFWLLTFRLIDKLAVIKSARVKLAYSVFFIFSLLKWMLFSIGMVYLLIKMV